MDKRSIRTRNLNIIRKALFNHEKLLASELVEITGFSMVTVNSLLKELIEAKEVLEGELIQQKVGRPAIEYVLDYDASFSLLLSIQEKKKGLCVYSELVNLNGVIKKQEEFDLLNITLEEVLFIIKNQLDAYPFVKKIGLSLPGKVHNGIVQSSWYEKFDYWPIIESIQNITSIPFYVQNDAHLITIGFALQQKLSLAKETIVGIFHPKTSMPGITILANQELIEGNLSLAGEAKFFPGFLEHPLPSSDEDLANRFLTLLSFYNVAIAPHSFILSSDGVVPKTVQHLIQQDSFLKKQPNQPNYYFVTEFQTCITLGLRWLIHKNSPYALE